MSLQVIYQARVGPESTFKQQSVSSHPKLCSVVKRKGDVIQ